MTTLEDLEVRTRNMEKSYAVHEAVCAERYKAILESQSHSSKAIADAQDWTNRLVMLANGLLILLLGAAAMGNPVVTLFHRVFGGQ